MLLATIICSDPGCDEEHEVAVEYLRQLDGFVCDCGHGYVLAVVAELEEPGGELIPIDKRAPRHGTIPRSRRRAA